MNILQQKKWLTSDVSIYFQFEEQLSTTETLPESATQFIACLGDKFTGKTAELFEAPFIEDGKIRYIVGVGLGKKSETTPQSIMTAVGTAIKAAKKIKAKDISFLVDAIEDQTMVTRIAETAKVADYQFDAYKSDRKDSTIETCTMITAFKDAVLEGEILADATLVARVLVNEPANVLNPITLAEEAVKLGKKHNFEVEVLDEKEIERLNMIAYLEVARASENKPRFIIMKHMGNPDSDEILGLVGKGLTFDSGGYSIKPKDSMLTMKSDMGGSAAVIGAMTAIASMKLKANVIAVVAACENMISGGGYRPGDIIGSRGGKTIYIQSTDAEGRLTLIDALDYIIKDLKATKVIDIATLTGACLVALGTTTTGTVSNNDAFYSVLDDASKVSGERVWRMPLFPEYKEILKHKEADLVNATRMAGMITAGMFIGEFAGDTPWIHMDIAGTSWQATGNTYQSYGGTGAGVKNLYYVAKKMA